MSVISDKMNKQSFQSYYYGLYVYNDYFYSLNMTATDENVYSTVLSGFSETN